MSVRTLKKGFLIIYLGLVIVIATGCWNYREVNEMAIVSGVAIDKGKDKHYEVTVEIIKISGGRETKNEPLTFSEEGDTLFDANRRHISALGSRLYWSHAQVIIISQDIAKEGINKILDWYMRDSETRSDVNIIISKEKTAKEVLTTQGKKALESIQSFKMEKTLTNENSLSEAPHTELWEMVNDIKGKGISSIAPVVSLKGEPDKKIPSIQGTAVFKEDKLVGFLNGEETKMLLFIKDQIKGGVLIHHVKGKNEEIPLSLEIFHNKTSLKPITKDDKVEMSLEINLEVAIDEVQGTLEYQDEKAVNDLENALGEELKSGVEDIIKKVQNEFGVDIFGFGASLYKDENKQWKQFEKDWPRYFKELEVKVIPKVIIRNTALLSKPLEKGD